MKFLERFCAKNRFSVVSKINLEFSVDFQKDTVFHIDLHWSNLSKSYFGRKKEPTQIFVMVYFLLNVKISD